MESISLAMAKKMSQYHLIHKDDICFYAYSIQLLIEKTIGFALIGVVALVFHAFIEIFLFQTVFITLRRYSDGIHLESTVGCFIVSAMVAISTLFTSRLLTNSYICQRGVILSMFFIILIGTINTPNLDLSPQELAYLKRKSRIVTGALGCVLIISCWIIPNYKYFQYLSLGFIYNAISILLAKILGKEVEEHE